MTDEVIDKAIGVRPLKLRPVLPVVLCQKYEGSAQNVFHIW